MDDWLFKELGINPDVNLLDDLYEYELACPEGEHEEEEDMDEEFENEESAEHTSRQQRKH